MISKRSEFDWLALASDRFYFSWQMQVNGSFAFPPQVKGKLKGFIQSLPAVYFHALREMQITAQILRYFLFYWTYSQQKAAMCRQFTGEQWLILSRSMKVIRPE